MTSRPDPLDEWVGRLCDGDAIDWKRERDELTRDGRLDDDHLHLLEALRVLDRVRQSSAAAMPDGNDRLPFPLWGSLRLIRKLGHGARSEVYEARDELLDKTVALKLFRPELTEDALVRTRLLQEARDLARVQSRHVATVLGVQINLGRLGLWMEPVPGADLAALVERDGLFPEARAIRIGRQVAEALARMHAVGLLHCDVKAANVILHDEGHAVVVDFGEVRSIERALDLPEDRSGTLLYMSPHVLETGAWTPQDDLYSLGVLLFHLVTGRYPVEATSPEELLARHADGDRMGLDSCRTSISPALVEVVEACLDAPTPTPAQRTTADAIVGALRALDAEPNGEDPPEADGAPGTPSRRPPVLALLAIVVLAVSLGTVLIVGNDDRPAPAGADLRANASPYVVRYDFDDALDPLDHPDFEVAGFDPSIWDPDAFPGQLTLYTHQGDTWNEERSGMTARNIVSIAAPGDSFVVTTRLLHFWPRHNWQQAGLMIMADQRNYVRLGMVSSGRFVDGDRRQEQRLQTVFERDDEVLDTASYHLWLTTDADGVERQHRFADDGPVPQTWLRIVRRGDHWTVMFSDNGINYRTLKEREFPLHTPRIALYALHGIGEGRTLNLTWDPIPARFDFLDVRGVPRKASTAATSSRD